MKRAITIALLFLLLPLAMAQKLIYQNRYKETGTMQTRLNMDTRDSSGNFYVLAEAESALLVQKVSPTGTVLWNYFYSTGILNGTTPVAIQVGTDGSVFVCGELEDFFSFPIINPKGTFVFRLSSAGALVWAKADWTHFGAGGMALDASNNPMVAEPRQDNQAQTAPENFDLVKYAFATGATVWTQLEQDASNIEVPWYVKSDGHGGVYVLEILNHTAAYQVQRLLATTGASVWKKTITPPTGLLDTFPQFLTVLSTGDALVSGFGHYTQTNWQILTFDRIAMASGAFTYRDFEGDLYTPGSYWIPTAPQADASGNVYWSGANLTGGSYGIAGKLDATGKLLWINADSFGSNSSGIVPAGDGGAFALYTSFPFNLLVRYDSTGQEAWTERVTQTTLADISLYSGTLAFLYHDSNAFLDTSIGLLLYSASTGAETATISEAPAGTVADVPQLSTKDGPGNTYVTSFQANRIAVAKYSGAGVLLWNTRINENLPEWNGQPVFLISSSLGNVGLLIAGKNNFGVAKINATTGVVEWTNLYSGAHGHLYPQSMVEDSLGNLIVGSATDIFGTSPPSYVVLDEFASATGGQTWEYVESDQFDAFPSLGIDSANNIYAVGSISSVSGSGFTLMKLTDAGAHVFTQTNVQNVLTSQPSYVAVDTLGNSYVAVLSKQTLYVYKYSSTGVLGWSNNWDLLGTPTAATFRLDAAHQALVFQAVPDSNFIQTIRISTANGSKIWSEEYNSPSLHGVTSAQMDIDHFGNVVMAVTVPLSANDPQKIYVRKLDVANGAVRYSAPYAGSGATNADQAMGITVGSDNTVWIQGEIPSLYGPASFNTFQAQFADTNAPICYPASYAAAKNGTLTVAAPGVLSFDEDGAGATVSVVANPTHAASFTLGTTGGFTYKPVANYAGTDTFTYKAKNGYGTSNTATVTITVK